MFPSAELLSMSVDQQRYLLDWWNTTESAKSVVKRLVSLVSELRLHPESSHADGMILFIGLFQKFHMDTQVQEDVYAGRLMMNTVKL